MSDPQSIAEHIIDEVNVNEHDAFITLLVASLNIPHPAYFGYDNNVEGVKKAYESVSNMPSIKYLEFLVDNSLYYLFDCYVTNTSEDERIDIYLNANTKVARKMTKYVRVDMIVNNPEIFVNTADKVRLGERLEMILWNWSDTYYHLRDACIAARINYDNLADRYHDDYVYKNVRDEDEYAAANLYAEECAEQFEALLETMRVCGYEAPQIEKFFFRHGNTIIEYNCTPVVKSSRVENTNGIIYDVD